MKILPVLAVMMITLGLSKTSAAEFGNDNCIVDEGVVTEIREERDRLKKKEAELQALEADLKKREEALQEQVAKLDELQKEVSKKKDGTQKMNEETVARLVETLEKMSPKAAAKMIAEIDEQLAVTTMSRMNTTILSKLMTNLDPQKSTRLSELMVLGRKKEVSSK